MDDTLFKKWYFILVVKESITREDITTALGSKEVEIIASVEKENFINTNRDTYEVIKNIEFSMSSLRMFLLYCAPDELIVSDDSYLLSNEEPIILLIGSEKN